MTDKSIREAQAPTIIIAIGAIFLFYLVRSAALYLISPASALVLLGIAATAALLFSLVNYENLPAIYVSLTRATACGLLFYLLVEPPSFTLANADFAFLQRFVGIGYLIAIGLAAASLWRPSFLFPASYYVISTRHLVDNISGFGLSNLDIRYMIEMAMFLSLCACGLALIGRLDRSKTFDRKPLAICLAFIAIGFHLGNYFWSGAAKLTLGPHPLSWAMENQTQNLLLAALKRGVSPVGAWPLGTQALYDYFGALVIPSNLFVLIVQLGSVIAVLKVNWLRIVTLAYDAFHIGIYVVGGLFFWPWVWNNFSIFWALRNELNESIGWAPKLCCIITILLGFSVYLGGSARLAWWDIADIKIATVQAQIDSRWVDVPVSYFMSHSYAASHGNFDLAHSKGHYAPTIWGTAYEYSRQVTSGTCPAPPNIRSETRQERKERLKRVSAFVRAHHARMKDKDWRNIYLRFHHHPSNPLMHRDFNYIKFGEVEKYRLLTQSVCMSLDGGELVERIVKQDEFEIDVR